MEMNSTIVNGGGPMQQLFGWLDITLFLLMLAVSTLIGVYFGFCGKKEDSPKEYLHGGKTMNTLPVAVSIASSMLSGITIMGVPSEIYTYGALYWLICFAAIFVGFINHFFYLPVFYELQLTSTYEYLQLRFNKSVRTMASVLYTIGLILHTPIALYVPALALSQVTGANIYVISVAISVLCIFYTMLGGLKAVVWTDFLQGIVMVVSGIIVIILGVIHVGGVQTVWNRSVEGQRVNFFEMNPSPTLRMSFWSATIGNTFAWSYVIAVNQGMVQKFMALPTYSQAKNALIFSVVGLIVIKSISCYTGLLIFATYYDCDPLQTKAISRPDQLLPYYVMDISGSMPGLPGLFVAGIFSASLSTMSSSLNALGATLFEDFVRPCFKNKLSDDGTASNIIKCVVVIIGAICVLMVFIVDKLGGVLQLGFSLVGVTSGPMLGLFTFGMFYPRGNSKGALTGGICSLLFMGWVVFENQKALADGSIKLLALPTSVEGCGFNVTLSNSTKTIGTEDEVFALYRVSFLYYTLMGLLVMLVVGVIVSLFTEKPNLADMNPALFTPIVRKYVLKKCKKKESASDSLLKTSSLL